MKIPFYKSALLVALGSLGLLLPVSSAQAQSGACRDYTKTSLLNGRVEISFAQACRDYGDRWQIVDVQGPLEMRDYMFGMIHRDLYAMNPRYVIVNNPGYYYSPAPERVVVYRQPAPTYVYNYPKNYKHAHYYKKDKHDHRRDHRDWKKHDRDDRHDRGRHHNNRNDDRRGNGMGSWR